MTCTCREGEICRDCVWPDMAQMPEPEDRAPAWLVVLQFAALIAVVGGGAVWVLGW